MIINALNKDAHYFTLDVHGGAILTEPLKFKQHDDNSRVLAIELTVHDDVKVDLTNARVDIWVRKPDGHLVVKAIDQKNIDLDSSIVVIPLTRQMLAVPPSIQCEIVVTYVNKSVLSFPIFEVEIEGSNVDINEVVSTSEFNLFYDALYRMEQWMRDYLTKYDIIDRAFKQKLEAMEQEKLRIIEEFEQLNASLITQNEIRFEELKQMTIGEFAEWFKEAKSQFAYAGREIEKRFNELYEKIVRMDSEVEDILNDCQSNQQVIHTIRSDVEELKRQVDEEYRKMCQLYEDAQVKFQEMQNTFKANEANRQTTFETNEARRSTEFINNESTRQNTFTQKENVRQNTFDTNEARRNTEFVNNETTRQNTFTQKENIRQNTFDTNEAQRQADFNNAQTQRTNEYRLAEDERNSSYETNEQVRDENYLRAETERQNDFIHNEGIREETFLAAETARNQGETTRRANEEERESSEDERKTNELARVSSERERQQGYTQMQNTVQSIYSTTLKYRIVE